MPQLLKKVEGEILKHIIGDVLFVSGVSGDIQQEDFINLKGFVAFLQNLKKVEETEALLIPLEYGLNNKYNVTTITLEISY